MKTETVAVLIPGLENFAIDFGHPISDRYNPDRKHRTRSIGIRTLIDTVHPDLLASGDTQ